LFGMESEAEFGLRYMEEESDDRRIRATRAADRTGTNDRHIIDSADSIAGYAQNRFVIGERLAITPGLRVESYEQDRRVLTENNAAASTSNTEVLPGVGATFELTEPAQLYGGACKDCHPPTNGGTLAGRQDQELEGVRSGQAEAVI